ncbi:nicotinate-nucleotide--dimethylbenzimidazole phosphoribosyltransferase [Methylobacterium gregans]|uniref:Nicotinate-nucleotide--dimethylbenzimidazole phosphoribosyltransferase n=1 Tax=Methylobacterium gregans TaxID=374424 RepID=A0AA37HN06_9HYPH|nr:nicotinate-nucleotide--dimethylbenzimidazole phosphoribosyltransferase [Methylobacterium gregans]MDQ0523078.1 nicotinate-nucleotide--dimethylbenzimidazole phosphoribosyltransferase [Methylobacterium gregans]GJD78565.1 Nicotinate-nucleotide--dimethylbenzimidazole phosphoribosyltransferase [Methylobacterium gregans]GLS56404.1 nicotinate-nucleotide--dimethylbenzimidazole phosphoribosyltransferase [Methylobacterium gregans]
MTESPFADIRRLIATMPEADAEAAGAVAARDAELTKPAGALGRLEELVAWLAAWQGKAPPSLDRPLVCVFAASHGVTRRGVSAFPDAVNRQMLDNFAAGGAAINQICATYGLGFKVFDLALDVPTGDICEGPALDERGCVATMAFGMESIAAGTDCLGIGEMGIGNTTIAAAIYAALFGAEPAHWVGRGTGVDAAGYARKVAVVETALAHHAGHLSDPLEVLRRLGGREIAAMAGAILAARLQRVPVVIDGYVSTAAAAVLHALDPSALDHCLAGHVSAEGAHEEVLERLGLKPLLALGMRLGEGSGAALAIGLLKGALACHRDMATFAQAGVSGRSGA